MPTLATRNSTCAVSVATPAAAKVAWEDGDQDSSETGAPANSTAAASPVVDSQLSDIRQRLARLQQRA